MEIVLMIIWSGNGDSAQSLEMNASCVRVSVRVYSVLESILFKFAPARA